MPGESTAFEDCFGSRAPLPPRVASLDEESTSYHDAKVDQLAVYVRPSAAASSSQQLSASTSKRGRNSIIIAPRQGSIPKLDTKASAVSVRTPSIHVKWSDVVALGSEAFRLRATTVPFNILPAIMKNADVFDALMLNCPDFPTLFALVASCTTAKHTFERHSQGIIKATLSRMPQELRYLTVALIGINGSKIVNSDSIKALMETWLGPGPKPLTKRLQYNPIETIRKLARSFSAINHFMQVIPKNCVNNFADYKAVVASRQGVDFLAVMSDWSLKHPILQQTEWSDVPDDMDWDVPSLPSGPQEIALPLTEGELYRIKRALLRYELFCSLFYLAPDMHFDTLHDTHRDRQDPPRSRQHAFREEQILFFNEYLNPWEVAELAVITQFMYDLVRNACFDKYISLRLTWAKAHVNRSFTNRGIYQERHPDHELVAPAFDNHTVWFTSQGLALLRKIYNDRKIGYEALIKKHCGPCYRLSECFVPIEKCANRVAWRTPNDPDASWKPRRAWPDTPGMELPSKGWLGKCPTIDFDPENNAYWGDKWMRKIGYYIWDRD